MDTMNDAAWPRNDEPASQRIPLPWNGLGWGAVVGIVAGLCCVVALTIGLASFWLFSASDGSYDDGSVGFGLMIVLVVGSLAGSGVGAVVGIALGTVLGFFRWERFASWVALPCASFPLMLAPRIVERPLTTSEAVLAVLHLLVVSVVFAGIGFGAGRAFEAKLRETDARVSDRHAALLDRAEMDRLIALQRAASD